MALAHPGLLTHCPCGLQHDATQPCTSHLTLAPSQALSESAPWPSYATATPCSSFHLTAPPTHTRQLTQSSPALAPALENRGCSHGRNYEGAETKRTASTLQSPTHRRQQWDGVREDSHSFPHTHTRSLTLPPSHSHSLTLPPSLVPSLTLPH